MWMVCLKVLVASKHVDIRGKEKGNAPVTKNKKLDKKGLYPLFCFGIMKKVRENALPIMGEIAGDRNHVVSDLIFFCNKLPISGDINGRSRRLYTIKHFRRTSK